jgi:hypothetical protein
MAIMHVDKHVMRDGSLHVLMSGDIDDDFDGSYILNSAQAGKPVVLHLGGIRVISSVGVRNLDDFVSAFAPRDVSLIHISPAVAAQIVMIPGLCGSARIESAKLPFHCPGCGSERQHSVPWKPRAAVDHAPKCSCGRMMELDGVEEQYLPS